MRQHWHVSIDNVVLVTAMAAVGFAALKLAAIWLEPRGGTAAKIAGGINFVVH